MSCWFIQWVGSTWRNYRRQSRRTACSISSSWSPGKCKCKCKCNAYLTQPTRIRLVLSCRVHGVNRTGGKRRQICLVSTQFPIRNSQSQTYGRLLKTWKLETGSRQNKSLLSCRQFCSHRRHGQGKTVLSCLVSNVDAISVRSRLCFTVLQQHA